MTELESSLTNVVGKPEVAPVVPAEPPEVKPEGNEAPENSQPIVNPDDSTLAWDKDGRFKRVWKGDDELLSYLNANPKAKAFMDNFYKSYHNIEKVYEPTKQKMTAYEGKINEINAIAKEFGITPEQLKDVLSEHKTFKDPENPTNKRASYLGNWIDNPIYKDQVISFFQDLESRELQRLYPNMSAEQIKKQVELEAKQTELESKLNSYEHEKLVTQYSSDIKNAEKQVKEYAASKGFNITDEMWSNCLKYCHENGIEPKYIKMAFRDMYDAEVDKGYIEKIKQDQLKALNKNKNNTVLPAKGATKPAVQAGSLRSMLNAAIGKNS